MALLLTQTWGATIRSSRPVDIHGDRFIDVVLTLDDSAGTPVKGRVTQTECPEGMTAGDRVEVSFTMGVITRITRPQRSRPGDHERAANV